MILYFSGTGNSKYLAEKLAKVLEDEIVDLFESIKTKQKGHFSSTKPYVLVSPTYSWRVPKIVTAYLTKAKFEGSQDFYVVINCGSSSGNATRYIQEEIEGMGMTFKGLFEIVMPENYIALFTLDSEETNRRIIAKADKEIIEAGRIISKGENFKKKSISMVDRFLSSVVNKISYSFIVKDKKFYYTDKCVKCGLCAKVCVTNNIVYEEGYPKWQGNCTHCMACISKCPTGAIEYGNKTVGKERYLLK